MSYTGLIIHPQNRCCEVTDLMMTVALLQMDLQFCQPQKNRAHLEALFDRALSTAPRPDVVCLPELWSTGFDEVLFHQIHDFAEPEDGPSLSLLRELARRYQVWILGGSLPIHHQDRTTRNTTYLIDRTGQLVGHYSKLHLFSLQREELAFTPGTETPVFDTELGKVAMMTCYDIRFCELARTYALKGAEVISVTANFPNPRLEHWRTLLTARAIENQSFVLACNRVGSAPGGTYPGHSMVIDPWGTILVEGGEQEEIVTAQLDLSLPAKVREQIQVFQDRRPQCYRITE